MSKQTITIKVTGTTEEVNLVTDYFPMDHVEDMSGRFPNNGEMERCHRFIRLDKQKVEDTVMEKHDELKRKIEEASV
ncbi:hypothetical protein [Carboxylicivirga marina]|uniref:hypothetical protein n=1 Tax=Carboxylicivirga marina TaxID=2800988 RepID=UPI002598B205|nr:hypothetical protein [uncultured Carboxylicivirga sp.]